MNKYDTEENISIPGPVLLTHLLLDMLKSSQPSRIVNVVAPAYSLGEIKWDDLNMENDYTPSAAYGQSQLAKVLFGIKLSKLLESK